MFETLEDQIKMGIKLQGPNLKLTKSNSMLQSIIWILSRCVRTGLKVQPEFTSKLWALSTCIYLLPLKEKESVNINTCSGEKPKVTSAFEAKLTSTAILKPRPLSRKGKTSEIMSQPIGPNDNCMTTDLVRSHSMNSSSEDM